MTHLPRSKKPSRPSLATIFNSTDIGSNSFSFQNSVASHQFLNSSIESSEMARDEKLSICSLYHKNKKTIDIQKQKLGYAVLQKYVKKERNTQFTRKQHRSLLSTQQLMQSKHLSNLSDSVYKSPTFYTDRSEKDGTSASLFLKSSANFQQENLGGSLQKFLNSEIQEETQQLELQPGNSALRVIQKYTNEPHSTRKIKKKSESIEYQNPFATLLKGKKIWQSLQNVLKRAKKQYWRKVKIGLSQANPRVIRFASRRMALLKTKIISRIKHVASKYRICYNRDFLPYRASIFRAYIHCVKRLKTERPLSLQFITCLKQLIIKRLRDDFIKIRKMPEQLYKKSRIFKVSKLMRKFKTGVTHSLASGMRFYHQKLKYAAFHNIAECVKQAQRSMKISTAARYLERVIQMRVLYKLIKQTQEVTNFVKYKQLKHKLLVFSHLRFFAHSRYKFYDSRATYGFKLLSFSKFKTRLYSHALERKKRLWNERMALRNYARVLSSKCLSSFRAHSCFANLKTQACKFYSSSFKKKIVQTIRQYCSYKKHKLIHFAVTLNDAVNRQQAGIFKLLIGIQRRKKIEEQVPFLTNVTQGILRSYAFELLHYCLREDNSEFEKAQIFRNKKQLMMIVEWWRKHTQVARKKRKLDQLVYKFGPIILKARGLEKLKINVRVSKHGKKLERRALRFWSFSQKKSVLKAWQQNCKDLNRKLKQFIIQRLQTNERKVMKNLQNEFKSKKPFYGNRKFKLIQSFHTLRRHARSSNPCERVLRQSFNCSNLFIQQHFIQQMYCEKTGDRPSRIFESINFDETRLITIEDRLQALKQLKLKRLFESFYSLTCLRRRILVGLFRMKKNHQKLRLIISQVQKYTKEKKREREVNKKAQMFQSFTMVRKVCWWWRRYTHKRRTFWQCDCRSKKY